MSRRRADGPEVVTRRGYLIVCALEAGADIFGATEAAASTALAHPEWDMTELRTFGEWDEWAAATYD